MTVFADVMQGREVEGRELAALRTWATKTFDIGGGRLKTVQCIAPIHYALPDGSMADIDLNPRDDGDWWLIDRAPYVLRISKTEPRIVYQGRVSGARVTFTHPGSGSVEFDGKGRGWWPDGTARDIAAFIRPGGVAAETWLRSEQADGTIRWEGGDPARLRGVDAKGNPVEIIEQRFTGRALTVVEVATRRREMRAATDWPVRIV